MCIINCLHVSAYDFIENGIAYNILKDGTLSVTHKWPQGWTLTNRDRNLTYKGEISIPVTVIHNSKKYKVSQIGSYAFYDCEHLNSLTIPEGIHKIEFNAISADFALTSLHIPASVKKLEPGFLWLCPNLKDITVAKNNNHYMSQGNCIYNKKMTELIYVCSSLKAYTFPASVSSVWDHAFFASQIKRLVIPETVKYIGGWAFKGETIGKIICKAKLKKLPGSQNYLVSSGQELPDWAYKN